MRILLACISCLPMALLLAGCGSSGDSDSEEVHVLSGVFVDSPVSGLDYSSGAQTGTTDASGGFTYELGKNVNFTVGGITLGSGLGQGVVTPVELVTGAVDEMDPTVTNIAAFLQSIDDDDDPNNGIAITSLQRDLAVNMNVNFEQSTHDFSQDGNVQTVVSELTAPTTAGARTLIDATTAQDHLRATLAGLIADYVGTYTGTIRTYCSSFDYTDPITVTITPTGLVDMPGTNQGSLVSGTIDYTGAVSGSSITIYSQSQGYVTLTYRGSTDGGNLNLIANSGEFHSEITVSK